MRLEHFLNEDTEELKKWGKTFGENHGKMPDEHGFFNECVLHMKDKIDDPEAYCASVIDAYKGTTKWRTGPKKTNEGAVDEMTKKVIYSCKACEYVKKCKYKNLHDGIPKDCPMEKDKE